MSTRHRMEAYRPAPRWISVWNSMYSKLAPHVTEILQPTGFYEKYDIALPDSTEGRNLDIEEKAAIERIASALTIAADAAHRTPPAVVRAWLDGIARNPALFRSGIVPPKADWLIASCYRRGSEAPGTYIQDIWGRRRVHFKAKAQRPTKPRIARAARLAAIRLALPRGRPVNIANNLLAEYLGLAFRSFGGRIVRRLEPVERKGGGVRWVEVGPFHQFLEKVIGPLQEHLRCERLQPVSIETIERIAAEQFA